MGKRKRYRLFWLAVAGLGWLGALATTVPTAVAQGNSSGISSPAPGDTLAGIVLVEGTAVHPEFLRYEVAFSFNGGEWVAFADGDQPVREGTLAVWDTTVGRQSGNPVFPDGAYRLRLRVVRQDYNYDELIVSGLVVSNDDATPTPTVTTTVPSSVIATPTIPGQAVNTPVPAILPSLTPFPTNTPPATPETGAVNPANNPTDDTPDGSGGIAGQLAAIDTNRFWQAAQLGLALTLGLFTLLAAYLLLRTVARRLLRRIRAPRKRD